MQDISQSPFITAPEAAKCLGISRSAIYDWLERGYLPYHRFGRIIRISKQDLANFLEQAKRTEPKSQYAALPTYRHSMPQIPQQAYAPQLPDYGSPMSRDMDLE